MPKLTRLEVLALGLGKQLILWQPLGRVAVVVAQVADANHIVRLAAFCHGVELGQLACKRVRGQCERLIFSEAHFFRGPFLQRLNSSEARFFRGTFLQSLSSAEPQFCRGSVL
jgi:hypothetical protein